MFIRQRAGSIMSAERKASAQRFLTSSPSLRTKQTHGMKCGRRKKTCTAQGQGLNTHSHTQTHTHYLGEPIDQTIPKGSQVLG